MKKKKKGKATLHRWCMNRLCESRDVGGRQYQRRYLKPGVLAVLHTASCQFGMFSSEEQLVRFCGLTGLLSERALISVPWRNISQKDVNSSSPLFCASLFRICSYCAPTLSTNINPLPLWPSLLSPDLVYMFILSDVMNFT